MNTTDSTSSTVPTPGSAFGPSSDVARLMRLATYASISAALVLVLAKLFAWWMSDSVSLLATLIDSTLDTLASLINLFAVRHALSPADEEHRFGHGKAEALSGLGQAVFIAGSAGFLLLQAGNRLMHPAALQGYETGVVVMLFSIAVTTGLLLFQNHVIKRTNSTAIRADALHYRTDLLVNVSVIAALLLSVWGWQGFDPVFAIAIAFYILYSAWAIVRQSLDHLMDRELPDSQRDEIARIAAAHPSVVGMHDLRTRQSGTSAFVQLHLDLDETLTIRQAHRISDEVESSLLDAYPSAEIIIHFDPVLVGDPLQD